MIRLKKPANEPFVNTDPGQIIRSLFINGDETMLMKKISGGDKVALFQLVMIHLPHIISFATSEHYKDGGITMAEIVDLTTKSFMEVAEANAANGQYEVDSWYRHASTAVDNFMEVRAIQYRRINYTPKRIAFLNQLNRLLKLKEQEIVNKVVVYINMMQQKMEHKQSSTNDYEVFAEVSYFTPKSNGDPIHTYYQSFHYNAAEGIGHGLLLSNENWREGNMPELEEPYCYLLHDLIDHSRIGSQLFYINNIWTYVKVWDQHCEVLMSGTKHI